MELLLEIISHQRHLMPETKSFFLFTTTGGTIGRGQDNDWSIDDPERLISGRHASIYYENKHFVIVDSSTNGVYVNQSELPLKENSHIILNGDKFSMGQYLFQATLIAPNNKAVFTPTSFSKVLSNSECQPNTIDKYLESNDHEPPLRLNQIMNESFDDVIQDIALFPKQTLEQCMVSNESINSFVDPISSEKNYFKLPEAIPENWQQGEQSEETVTVGRGKSLEKKKTMKKNDIERDMYSSVGDFEDFKKDFNLSHSNKVNECMENKNIMMTRGELFKSINNSNNHADDTMDVCSELHAKDDVKESQSTDEEIDYESMMYVLIESLGLKKDDIKKEQLPELIKNVGVITRLSLNGLLKSALTQSHLKNEFRLSNTTVKSQENNPIKFSINYQQLVQFMLLNTTHGYLNAEEAVKQSFDEFQEHQIGVMSGMKSALIHMFDRLSPKKIISKTHSTESKSLILMNKNHFYWKSFLTIYNNYLDEEDVFDTLFLNVFCKAYETQIEQVRSLKSNAPD